MSKETDARLRKIEALLLELKASQQKPMDLGEAAQYLRISKSHLYQKTSRREIAHFKPEGKKIYFRREDLDSYLLRNRRGTCEEVETATANHIVGRPASELGRAPAA